MRAIRARYDPYKQARGRVDQLRRLGHSVDKVEFILMGGTFMSLPMDYRDYFVRNLHDALSGHSSKNVAEAVRFSEQSATRCIGMTIETRPRLLSDAAPVGHAVLRVHSAGDRAAVHVRGRCARYESGTHSGCRRRVLRARQKCRVQGGGAPHGA